MESFQIIFLAIGIILLGVVGMGQLIMISDLKDRVEVLENAQEGEM